MAAATVVESRRGADVDGAKAEAADTAAGVGVTLRRLFLAHLSPSEVGSLRFDTMCSSFVKSITMGGNSVQDSL